MLTLADILAVLAPSPIPWDLGVGSAGRVPVGKVCIDSRQVGPGSLFVALRGENTDGHSYVSHAFDAGASLALVERPIPGLATIELARPVAPQAIRLPVALVVPDALQALQQLAQAQRQARPELRVVGVTGSVGKTTTKEAISAVLSRHGPTIKSAGNYNNEIGLPLTLMALKPEHEYAVLEMGMYAPGEIALLCTIASPQVGVVTNVGPTHLERLGTIERIAQAKAELIEALPTDGLAILNGDDFRVRAMGAKTTARVVTFGLNDDNTVWADAIENRGLEGVRFIARINEPASLDVEVPSWPLELSLLGRHAVWSALAAVAVGLVEGLNWAEIEMGLLTLGCGLRLVPKAGLRGATLLDDSYNASPISSLAALDLLAELPGRHLAALGDMLELGTHEAEGHRVVGRRCAQVLDMLVTVGERARFIAEGALEAGLPVSALHSVDNNESAIKILSECLQEGDTLLVKGSRSMAMEKIVCSLEQPTPSHNAASCNAMSQGTLAEEQV